MTNNLSLEETFKFSPTKNFRIKVFVSKLIRNIEQQKGNYWVEYILEFRIYLDDILHKLHARCLEVNLWILGIVTGR